MRLLVFFTTCFCLGMIPRPQAQSYQSYLTGNPEDTKTSPLGGICMMGGAKEDDHAMRWFLSRASGGDVLVLRASGSDGYNSYMHRMEGVSVNSVETLVFKEAEASQDPYIIRKIAQAEAIWFAGGDQWNYVRFWRHTPVDSAINEAIVNRNIVIGGTSAGMAILGKYYFSAQNGSITAEQALMDPFHLNMTVDAQPFLHMPLLQNVITDTHFANRNRQGRLFAFLARAFSAGFPLHAIACDERTAVCIDPEGIASVFGQYPEQLGHAYFLRPLSKRKAAGPELCIAQRPLTWSRKGKALLVYKVSGHQEGAHTFDLNDWTTASGGAWEYWSSKEGKLNMSPGERPPQRSSKPRP